VRIMRILLVEDEAQMTDALASALVEIHSIRGVGYLLKKLP
jgi:hypothetical protein